MKKSSPLTVFVVRHGERLDLAMKKRGERVPSELKLDPPLTSHGHEQAHEAFSKLAQGLEQDGTKRKIAVFSSPTKRAIGTSLMLTTSGMNRIPFIDWGFQRSVSATHKEDDSSNNKKTLHDSTIPITVLNGLGSCAARIAHHGGAEACVKEGWLPCADFSDNDGSDNCPAAEELRKMQAISPDGLGSDNKDVAQYWKLDQQNQTLIPLAPPVSPLVDTLEHPVRSIGYHEVPDHCLPQTKNEYFWQALDRAVLLAEADGCDTLIVVAHREAVREMLARWKTNGYRDPDRLNYCCIASFVAQTYDNHSCRWCYHGVVDYQNFTIDNVPSKERWKQKQARKKGMDNGESGQVQLARITCSKDVERDIEV